MKSKVLVIKNLKKKIILMCLFIVLIFLVIQNMNSKNIAINHNSGQTVQTLSNVEKSVDDKSEQIPKSEMVIEINGDKAIGKLKIPKINFESYILSKTTEENLDKSITKLCGPKINSVGNLCIVGHNYNKKNMFGKLKKLSIGDSIYLTDIFGETLEYKVYEIKKVNPKETECLSQETFGRKEVTLITCTTGAIKRLVIKASIYKN